MIFMNVNVPWKHALSPTSFHIAHARAADWKFSNPLSVNTMDHRERQRWTTLLGEESDAGSHLEGHEYFQRLSGVIQEHLAICICTEFVWDRVTVKCFTCHRMACRPRIKVTSAILLPFCWVIPVAHMYSFRFQWNPHSMQKYVKTSWREAKCSSVCPFAWLAGELLKEWVFRVRAHACANMSAQAPWRPRRGRSLQKLPMQRNQDCKQVHICFCVWISWLGLYWRIVWTTHPTGCICCYWPFGLHTHIGKQVTHA